MEIVLHCEGGVSIVVDMPAPQVLEELVEMTKFITYEQLADPLTMQVSCIFIFLNIIFEHFCKSMEDAGSNKGPYIPGRA